MILNRNLFFREFSLGLINTGDLISADSDLLHTDFDSQILKSFGEELSYDDYQIQSPQALSLEHMTKLPILDEFITDWNFHVDLSPESASKTSYMYSSKLNKVFVKMNTHLHLYPTYSNIDPNKELSIRAMIVYTSQNDLAEPVKKCPNHKDRDNSDHILKCDLPDTRYVGHETGKLFQEKLATVIPLCSIAPNEPFKLLFTCQNSCSGGINRKMTSLVFTLEDNFGYIMGRKIMNFKVCSCPKRDKDKDEAAGVAKSLPKKRKAETSAAPSTSKKMAVGPVIKQESAVTLPMDDDLMSQPSNELLNITGLTNPKDVDMKKEQLSCELTIQLPNTEIKKQVLQQAYNIVAGEMTRSGDGVLHSYLNNIQKQMGK